MATYDRVIAILEATPGCASAAVLDCVKDDVETSSLLDASGARSVDPMDEIVDSISRKFDRRVKAVSSLFHVVLGAVGAGKSHLCSRLRERAEASEFFTCSTNCTLLVGKTNGLIVAELRKLFRLAVCRKPAVILLDNFHTLNLATPPEVPL